MKAPEKHFIMLSSIKFFDISINYWFNHATFIFSFVSYRFFKNNYSFIHFLIRYSNLIVLKPNKTNLVC